MAGSNSEKYKYYAHEGESYSLSDNTNPWDWATSLMSGGGTGNGLSTVHRHAEYMDQIMPFNITLIAQNEYGLAAWKAILGIEILNEGGGLSVDDITNEEQTTYVARAATAWVPWVSQEQQNSEGIGYFWGEAGQQEAGETTVLAAGASGVLENYKNWLGIPTT